MNINQSLITYTLHLADNAIIIGHRLSEWCGHGPFLEQDIALTNISLDHLGSARSLYQYAAQLFNNLPAEEKQTYFSSAGLLQKVVSGALLDEDDLAYLRDAWDYKNILLLEQLNKDWGFTVVRSFLYDVYNFLMYRELSLSADNELAAIAAKSLKEVTYHLKWSSEWIIRLGDGTTESHEKVQSAINTLWPFIGEMFLTTDYEINLSEISIIPVLPSLLKDEWLEKVKNIFVEATLQQPTNTWMQKGGKEGIHSEHLGFLLAELQFMQRAYPDMEW